MSSDISGSTPHIEADPAPAPAEAAAPVRPLPPNPVQGAGVGGSVRPEFEVAISAILKDLSGASVQNVGDLLRFVPRLAAVAETLHDVSKPEKRALVIAAGHRLVELALPVEAREDANRLVDVIFPGALAGVIDVVRGRVSFEDAAKAVAQSAAPVVVEVAQKKCLPLLLSCLKK